MTPSKQKVKICKILQKRVFAFLENCVTFWQFFAKKKAIKNI